MKKWIAGGVAIAIALAVGAVIAAASVFLLVIEAGSNPAAAACLPPGMTPPPALQQPPVQNAPIGGFDIWDAKQVGHAATIVAVGKQKNVPPRGWVIALATAMQESTLHNHGHLGARNDHDSVGLFQQRPASGWGTPEELTTPEIAAKKFYNALLKVNGWQGMSLTVAAQTVQRSAFPDAYAKWEDEADRLAAHVAGLKSIGDVAGGAPGAECIVKPVAINEPIPDASGWVNPVKASVGSAFRSPSRPSHDGVDLIAPRHTPIWAAAAGKVTRIRCNSSSGTCDRDGSPSVAGCGWYAEVRHAGNIVTRYCHMVSRPKVRLGQNVRAGQLIGNVGSSGGSSGPHLHYEVHLNVPQGQNAQEHNAVNPVPHHKRIGAPLGRK